MINDDELILYYYDDGLSAERRAAIATLLRSDLTLARRYQQIGAELNRLPAAALAEPSDAARARWRLRLDQRAASADARPRSRGQWSLALAGATLVLLGVAIGTRIAEQTSVAAPMAIAAADSGPPLARGVSSHLGDARLLLAELPQDDAAQRSALVTQLIEQNRWYERAASAQGDQRLARVLRAFEPVLASLADDQAGSEADQAARAQLDFELGVVQTKLSRSPSKIVQSL